MSEYRVVRSHGRRLSTAVAEVEEKFRLKWSVIGGKRLTFVLIWATRKTVDD